MRTSPIVFNSLYCKFRLVRLCRVFTDPVTYVILADQVSFIKVLLAVIYFIFNHYVISAMWQGPGPVMDYFSFLHLFRCTLYNNFKQAVGPGVTCHQEVMCYCRSS